MLSLIVFYCTSVNKTEQEQIKDIASTDTVKPLPPEEPVIVTDTTLTPLVNGKAIDTKNVSPTELLAFARTQIGVPYLYASTDPAKGFDCSGFITYVFNHFNIAVPRSSVDFTNYGNEVSIAQSQPGDLILFTGTDSTDRTVGHMGIVEHPASDTLRFIHSSSGKANGVVITELGDYYKSRFVKVIRIFPSRFFYTNN